jgi:hypothetical protein
LGKQLSPGQRYGWGFSFAEWFGFEEEAGRREFRLPQLRENPAD